MDRVCQLLDGTVQQLTQRSEWDGKAEFHRVLPGVQQEAGG